jgi:cytochrome b6-f complex iron-sulfur subunit
MRPLERRKFLTRAWQFGGTLIGGAGLWTSWDLLRPGEAKGFGGNIRTIAPEAVTDSGAVEIPAARAYLVRIDGEVRALSQKCTHLGCRVPYCDSSGQFECPCHGTVFNRAGEHRSGPAPRGMDSHPVELGDDGLLYIDTGSTDDGPANGTETIDEPPTGPLCETGHG